MKSTTRYQILFGIDNLINDWLSNSLLAVEGEPRARQCRTEMSLVRAGGYPIRHLIVAFTFDAQLSL
jgi:hypothetical protein